MIEIKRWDNGEVIHSGEFDSIKECFEDGIRREISFSLRHGIYKLEIIDDMCWGGCTKKTLPEWLEYTGDDVPESDRIYLETVTKPFIKMVIAFRDIK